MKTDRELLELAAKAADIRLIGLVNKMIVQPDHRAGGFIVRNERGGDSSWNPLTDDGDALRLAVKLCIDINHAENIVVAEHLGEDIGYAEGYTKSDPYAAARRAIVRVAAAIGEAM